MRDRIRVNGRIYRPVNEKIERLTYNDKVRDETDAIALMDNALNLLGLVRQSNSRIHLKGNVKRNLLKSIDFLEDALDELEGNEEDF